MISLNHTTQGEVKGADPDRATTVETTAAINGASNPRPEQPSLASCNNRGVGPIKLPTEKTRPQLDPATAKVLLYGRPKIGKSTLAASIDPDHTLFLACEEGLGGLSTYQLPIKTWNEFREAGALLASGEHHYTTVVVDTVDELLQLCQEDVLKRLRVEHPGDVAHGKGWRAISDEFVLRVGKLCDLGMGVWFVSHAHTTQNKTNLGEITVTEPTLSGRSYRWLTGLVDFIFLAQSRLGKDGEERLLRTQAGEGYEAGGRLHLPDPLPLDSAALKAAMEAAQKQVTSQRSDQ